MRFLHFHDQAVCPEQSQLAGDRCGLSALYLLVVAGPVQGGTQVAIAEAIEQKLALSQATQQFAIGSGAGIQGPSTAAVLVLDRTTQRFQQFAQRSRVRY